MDKFMLPKNSYICYIKYVLILSCFGCFEILFEIRVPHKATAEILEVDF